MSAGEDGEEDPLQDEDEGWAAKCILALETLFTEIPLALGEEFDEGTGDVLVIVSWRKKWRFFIS